VSGRECAQISHSSFRSSFTVLTGALILVMPAEHVSGPENRVAGLGSSVLGGTVVDAQREVVTNAGCRRHVSCY
jgi:hypothetical protein